MTELDDHELLAAYARTASETAFGTLVARYVNLVYSAALRFTANPHHAEEISQAVFIILARKAGSLDHGVVLSGWLYQTARLTAANFVKAEIRRQNREQEAYMQSTMNEPETAAWQQIAPLLDDAMGRLGETDRNAVVLRFFENKSAREVGAALRMDEGTARKRVLRALEKLRKIFAGRGIVVSTAAFSGAVSAHSVHAAPAGLAATISHVVLTHGAAGGSTLTLVKGALKIMAWTKAKTVVVVGVVALLAAGTTTVTFEKIHEDQNEAWQLGKLNFELLQAAPVRTTILPTRSAQRSRLVGSGGMISAADGRVMSINSSIEDMVRSAYSPDGLVSLARTVFAPTVPTNHYDFYSNLPTGAKAALQGEIQRKFGLAGHFETIDTNVMFLRVSHPNAPGLRPAVAAHGSSDIGNGYLSVQGETMADLAGQLESSYSLPVIDQTGLTNRYDFKIDWSPYSDKIENSDSNHPVPKNLADVLNSQLGLELVPGTAPVKILFVEKVK